MSSHHRAFAGSQASPSAVAQALATSLTRTSGREQPTTTRSRAVDETSQSATSAEPPNFSRIDTSAPASQTKTLFPKFREAEKHRLEIEVKAGQMLYLPAGWFHEVFSSSDGQSSGHCAFNMWFHSPDNHDYRKPYVSEFWAQDMKARKAQKSLT